MPQSKAVRLTERSFRPERTKLSDFVAALLGPDEIRLALVKRQQAVLIGRELEEIALLLHPFHRRAVWGRGGCRPRRPRFRPRRNRLRRAPNTSLNRWRGRYRPPPPSASRSAAQAFVMTLLGRADEIVVARRRALRPCRGTRAALRSASSRAVNAFARRRLQHLLAVLVRAGEEEHVVAVQPLEAGDGVGRDQLIGMPDMRACRWDRRSRS